MKLKNPRNLRIKDNNSARGCRARYIHVYVIDSRSNTLLNDFNGRLFKKNVINNTYLSWITHGFCKTLIWHMYKWTAVAFS